MELSLRNAVRAQCLPFGVVDMKSSPPPQRRTRSNGTGVSSSGMSIIAIFPDWSTTQAKISQNKTAVKRSAVHPIFTMGWSAIFTLAVHCVGLW